MAGSTLETIVAIAAAAFAGMLVVATVLVARRTTEFSIGSIGMRSAERMTSDEPDLDQLLVNLGKTKAPVEDKQLALFIRYHDETRSYARLISTFSLLFAGIGFCTIIFAFVTADPETAVTEQGRALFTTFGGVVIEAVSALFFVQSNRARAALTEFLDRLREDRKLDKALDLAAGVSDPPLRARAEVIIALSFIGRPVSDKLLTDLFEIDTERSTRGAESNDSQQTGTGSPDRTG